MVAFNSIPNNIRTPGVYIEHDASGAVTGTVGATKRILLIGTKVGGTQPVDVPVDVTSGEDGVALFGARSMLAQMIRKAKLSGETTRMTAIGVAGAGTSATYTITWTGPATESGVAALLIGGRRVQVPIADGDTANDIAAAAQTAIAADPDLVVTSSTATNVNTLTVAWAGTSGNGLDIRHSYFPGESLPAGVSVAIAAGVVAAGSADISNAIAAMADTQYTHIGLGYTDAPNLNAIKTELEARFGPMDQKWGYAFACLRDTHANLITAGNARNDFTLSLLGVETGPTPTWEYAAQAASITGHEPDPARPLQTLPYTDALPPNPEDRFTRAERDILLNNGIATIKTSAAGQVQVERMISNYQLSPAGAPDVAYLDQRTFESINAFRDAVRNRFLLRYPRHKLADDGTDFEPTQPVMTPSLARAEIISVARAFERVAILEDIDGFKETLIVERSTTDRNRLEYKCNPNIVNGFRVLAGSHAFIL